MRNPANSRGVEDGLREDSPEKKPQISHRVYCEKRGTFDSEKGICLFIYWNLIYLSYVSNDVTDLVPDKKDNLSHETYENVKKFLELNT